MGWKKWHVSFVSPLLPIKCSPAESQWVQRKPFHLFYPTAFTLNCSSATSTCSPLSFFSIIPLFSLFIPSPLWLWALVSALPHHTSPLLAPSLPLRCHLLASHLWWEQWWPLTAFRLFYDILQMRLFGEGARQLSWVPAVGGQALRWMWGGAFFRTCSALWGAKTDVCLSGCLFDFEPGQLGWHTCELEEVFSFFSFLNPDPGDCSVLDPDPDGIPPPSVLLEMWSDGGWLRWRGLIMEVKPREPQVTGNITALHDNIMQTVRWRLSVL